MGLTRRRPTPPRRWVRRADATRSRRCSRCRRGRRRRSVLADGRPSARRTGSDAQRPEPAIGPERDRGRLNAVAAAAARLELAQCVDTLREERERTIRAWRPEPQERPAAHLVAVSRVENLAGRQARRAERRNGVRFSQATAAQARGLRGGRVEEDPYSETDVGFALDSAGANVIVGTPTSIRWGRPLCSVVNGEHDRLRVKAADWCQQVTKEE